MKPISYNPPHINTDARVETLYPYSHLHMTMYRYIHTQVSRKWYINQYLVNSKQFIHSTYKQTYVHLVRSVLDTKKIEFQQKKMANGKYLDFCTIYL